MNQSTFPRPQLPADFDWNQAIARGRAEQALAVHQAFVWLKSVLTRSRQRVDDRDAANAGLRI